MPDEGVLVFVEQPDDQRPDDRQPSRRDRGGDRSCEVGKHGRGAGLARAGGRRSGIVRHGLKPDASTQEHTSRLSTVQGELQ
ncbi:hypothetical protein SDC9_129716 [bioreactor metagenome]|uniref:Uncharacterized protein n=1 Tax=bioreactor metagenome TaxID=1076179 RepID=A0A645D0B7_9ZZZZ